MPSTPIRARPPKPPIVASTARTGVPAWSGFQSAIFEVVGTLSVSLMSGACHPTLAREDVDSEGHIHQPGPRSNIREVGDPPGVRRARGEIPVQQIRSPLRVLLPCPGFRAGTRPYMASSRISRFHGYWPRRGLPAQSGGHFRPSVQGLQVLLRLLQRVDDDSVRESPGGRRLDFSRTRKSAGIIAASSPVRFSISA